MGPQNILVLHRPENSIHTGIKINFLHRRQIKKFWDENDCVKLKSSVTETTKRSTIVFCAGKLYKQSVLNPKFYHDQFDGKKFSNYFRSFDSRIV